MKANITDAGRVAISVQGHDRGRWYCVTAVDQQGFLLCCDGQYRTLDKPKKKQKKHMVSLPFQIDLKAKGGSGGLFSDSDLRKALKECQKQYEAVTEWPNTVMRDLQKEECALVQK